MGLQENMSETMGQLKQEHNLSTEEFSSKLDVSKASLQSYLYGRGNPREALNKQLSFCS